MDVYRPGPRRLLIATFLLGGLSTIFAGLLEGVFVYGTELDIEGASLASTAVAMLLVVGPVEEVCKFRSRAASTPSARSISTSRLDGMVYGAAASLGFATVENIGYVRGFWGRRS